MPKMDFFVTVVKGQSQVSRDGVSKVAYATVDPEETPSVIVQPRINDEAVEDASKATYKVITNHTSLTIKWKEASVYPKSAVPTVVYQAMVRMYNGERVVVGYASEANEIAACVCAYVDAANQVVEEYRQACATSENLSLFV